MQVKPHSGEAAFRSLRQCLHSILANEGLGYHLACSFSYACFLSWLFPTGVSLELQFSYGYSALFKGILPRVLRTSPQYGMMLLSYELLQKFFIEDDLPETILEPMEVGFRVSDKWMNLRQWGTSFHLTLCVHPELKRAVRRQRCNSSCRAAAVLYSKSCQVYSNSCGGSSQCLGHKSAL